MECKKRLMGSDLTKSLFYVSSLFLWKLLSEVQGGEWFNVPHMGQVEPQGGNLQNPCQTGRTQHFCINSIFL